MSRILSCILYFIVFHFVASLKCDKLPPLPKSFVLKQSWFTWVPNYYTNINSDKYDFRRDAFTFTNDLTAYYNKSIIGSTSTLLFSWAQVIHFYDCNGKKIFTVLEYSPLYNLNGIDMYYTILDKNSNKIGSIEHTNYFSTSVLRFFDFEKNLIIKAHSIFWSIGSEWEIDVYNHQNKIVDIRLIGSFVAYNQIKNEQRKRDNSQSNSAGTNSAYISDQIEKQANFSIVDIEHFFHEQLTTSNLKEPNPDIYNIGIIIISIILFLVITMIFLNRWSVMPIYPMYFVHSYTEIPSYENI